ncbi:MAG: toxin-antitoxin system protein [Dehalococcoidia bacterium]|nr:toxin-antitoxin system protein [Dehalococcoidia bacterium]
MKTVTVRVPSEIRRTLQQLAGASNRNMQSVLAQAVEEYRRRWVLDRTNQAYAELRSRSDLWAEEEEERRAWEATLSDDLKGER